MTRFDSILCVVDVRKASEQVLELAVDVAERNQSELTLIDIIEPRPTGLRAIADHWTDSAIETRRQQRLDALAAPFKNRIDITTQTATGVPFLSIIRAVLRYDYDLVIRASENPDWLDRLLGSDDMHLLRKCPCPVWMVKASAPITSRRILAAVDVDRQYPERELRTRHDLNLRVLDFALSLALAESAELHVVHTWQILSSVGAYPEMPHDILTDYIEQTRDDHQRDLTSLLSEATHSIGPDARKLLDIEKHLVNGQPRHEIPALARELSAETVVMGSVARTGIPGFLMGNTAETILNQLDCSVLVVKPLNFETPVKLDEF